MASSNRRQRELAAARAERRHARLQAAAGKQARNQRFARIAVALGLIIGFLLVWNKPWQPKSTVASPQVSATPSTTPTSQSTPTTPTNTSPSANPTAPTMPPAQTAYQPRPGRFASMTFDLAQGPVAIELDNRAPRTLESMAKLSAKRFFNGTSCHRLTNQGIYVLQCGDPQGNGTGGPGYTIADENLPSPANGLLTTAGAVYPRGIVAMANSGPNTNGSQFFLVYKDSPLPPNYTVWGRVTSGLDVIDRIAAAGISGGSPDGRPNLPVVIKATSVK